jgi:hypothetical protein
MCGCLGKLGIRDELAQIALRGDSNRMRRRGVEVRRALVANV